MCGHNVVRSISIAQQMFDQLPDIMVLEGNIAVYLAGYLCARAISKFNCNSCQSIWKATDEEQQSLSTKYAFFNH